MPVVPSDHGWGERFQTGFLTETSREALSFRTERDSEPVAQGSPP